MKSFFVCMLLVVIGSSHAAAQRVWADTFQVTLVLKSPNHPHYHQEWDSALAIDGVEAVNLTLVRGWTYYFKFNNVSRKGTMWLAIPNEAKGWLTGTSPYGPFGNVLWRFTPPSNVPDLLYYWTAGGPLTGGEFNFVDSVALGLPQEEGRIAGATAASGTVWPNPASSTARITYSIGMATDVRLIVVDNIGREVYASAQRSRSDGTGDFLVNADELAPGIYFYRVAGTKIISTIIGTLVVMR